MTQQAAVATQVKTESHIGLKLMIITFRVSTILTLFLIAMIGIFSIASLIGGTISAGGPLELAKGWFSAVNGL